MKQIKPNVWMSGVLASLLMIQGCGHLGSSPDKQDKHDNVANETRAIIVPGGGTYSREISTDSAEAQLFFDQGLRFAWGFFFPESIASYQ